MALTTYSSRGLIEIQGAKGNVELVNFKKDSSVKITKQGKAFTVDSYSFGTVKGNVKVCRGRWMYELKVVYNSSVRFGWSTEEYAPESNYEGVGSDSDSWSWDGSRLYHDEKRNPTSKPYGEYWASGDVLGCTIDFDSREIRFTRNGRDLGVAFKNVRNSNSLVPCISMNRGADIEVCWGPSFQHKKQGFYGISPTLNAEQKKALLNIFLKYHRIGSTLRDSLSTDIMKARGVMALGNDLGAEGPLDPHLLLLAWKMRSKNFFEFSDTEWMVLWANEGISSFDGIKKCVLQWIKDIATNKDDYTSFYGFSFDYMKLEKGDRATVLEKQDAQMLWELLGIDKKFKFYSHWIKFWEEEGDKGITKDTWMMLLSFIEKIGDNINNYSEDDCWPLKFDEFVDFLKSQ